MIANTYSRIFGATSVSPEILELPQNDCMIAYTDFKKFGINHELRDRNHRFQNFWNCRKNFCIIANKDPEYLDSNTNSRISGTPTENLCDRKDQFQNFWNITENLYGCICVVASVWSQTSIPEIQDRPDLLCDRNHLSRISE